MNTQMMILPLCFAIGCVAGSGNPKTELRSVGSFTRVLTTDMVDVDIVQDVDFDGLEVTCDDNLLDILKTDVRGGELHVHFPSGPGVAPRAECVVVTGNMNVTELVSTGSGDVYVSGPAWGLSTVRTTGSGDVDIRFKAGEPEGDSLVDDSAGTGLVDSEDSDDEGFVEDASDEVALESDGTGQLDVTSTGSGDVHITGLDLTGVTLRTTGSGDMKLAGEANRLDATSTGSGDVHARGLSANVVDLRTTGSGDMTAKAHTKATVRSTGSGDVTVYGNPDKRNKSASGSGDIRFR